MAKIKNVSETDTNNTENTETETAAEITETATSKVTAPAEEPAESPPEKTRFEGITNFVYAGPSLPGGRLKKYALLSGTYAEIAEYYKDTIAEYPSVARLITPAHRFAETRDKTQTSGNILYNFYQEIVTAIKAKGVEQ